MEQCIKLNQNTETACALCEREFLHEEFIELIKNGEAIEKQIALLRLDGVFSQEEADLLFFYLTNQHGIIREAAAEKINELMKNENFRLFFQTENIRNTILDAVIDMNPNICRLIIEILPLIEDKRYFFEKLFERAVEVIDDAATMNIRNKGYIYSKKVFKIFWYLEAAASLDFLCVQNLAEIRILIEKAAVFKDYTVREKAAKILIQNAETIDLPQIESLLKNDENYFVRRFFYFMEGF